MTPVQVLFFLIATLVLMGSGAALILPPLRTGRTEVLQSRILLAVTVKFLLGVALLLVAWKGLGWPDAMSAFGMVTAYLLALIGVTVLVANATRRKGG